MIRRSGPYATQATWMASSGHFDTSSGKDTTRCRSSAVATRAAESSPFATGRDLLAEVPDALPVAARRGLADAAEPPVSTAHASPLVPGVLGTL